MVFTDVRANLLLYIREIRYGVKTNEYPPSLLEILRYFMRL